VKVTGTRHIPSPSAVGRGDSMLTCYEFDEGISNTDLMWEMDVRLATLPPASKRVRQVGNLSSFTSNENTCTTENEVISFSVVAPVRVWAR